MMRWIRAKPATNMASTKKYIVRSSLRSIRPNSLPRGMLWMPSSAYVKGACTQMK